MSLRDQPSTKFIPSLQEAGVPHVVAAAELGVGVQVTGAITLVGASPHAISFADLVSASGLTGIQAPLDTDYVPMVAGNSAGLPDLTSRTREGFSLVGGAENDVVAFVIWGRFGSMKR